ncbi:MAG: hypothetical protein AAGF23_22025, partial [Acidobacteriota bacterium]
DPALGDSRYQLEGSLSGGMIAVPPFGVVPGVREPLRFPRTGRTNTNGDDAVAIEIFDGNLQIGVVGETLSDADDAISLKVVVSDERGTPVRSAPVTFEVIAGGGSFGGASSTTVESGWGGLTEVELTLGTRTDGDPYYLLFPEERFAQRVGLNLVRAEVNGYGMRDLFYLFGHPDDLAELQTPNGADFSGLPHISLSSSLRVLPADQYGNPISNVDVTFNLEGGVSGEPDEGPALLERGDKLACRPGPVVAGECAGETASLTGSGGVLGFWSWLIVGGEGPHRVVAGAVDSEGTPVETTFTASVQTSSIPGAGFVGWPLLLVSGRGQVRDDATGESVEAYPPGGEAVPIQISVFAVREDFGISSCGGALCSVPLGTYTTTRVGQEPAAACFSASCAVGTLGESVSVSIDGPGGGGSTSTPDADGMYSFTPDLPDETGRHVYVAMPSATVAVPKPPKNPLFLNEIVPCGGEPPCGAEMELIDISNPEWRTEYVLWTVRGQINDPPPVVKLGHRNRLETEVAFPYTIEPANYPAINTFAYFLENDVVPLFAQAEGAGPGQATLPVGEVFSEPEGEHAVAMAVNVGRSWSPRSGVSVPLTVVSDPVPFSVVMFDVDVDSDNDNGVQPPERNDAEEALEEEGGPRELGKIVFVNHDDDDGGLGDSIPDFADPQIPEEDNLVPVVIELRPEGGEWAAAELTFTYDGTKDDAELPGTAPVEELGRKGDFVYLDYGPKKTGSLRLWRLDEPGDERTADRYLEPGEPFGAGGLGFSAETPAVTFWIEAINGARAEGERVGQTLSVALSFAGESVTEDVLLTPLEHNLGFNNSNSGRTCRDDATGEEYRCLRVGVPDGRLTWASDEHDEAVEDQGDGFRFWVADEGFPSESTL